MIGHDLTKSDQILPAKGFCTKQIDANVGSGMELIPLSFSARAVFSLGEESGKKGEIMKIGVIAAIAAFAMSATASQAQEAKPDCYDDVFGRFCKTAAPLPPKTNSDYGVIYIAVRPPDSVTASVLKSKNSGWRNWLRKYFIPQVKQGQIVVELTRSVAGVQQKLATIPVASFTVDENDGVTVDKSTPWSGSVPVTPYFRLDNASNAITANITVRSTKEQGSNIVSAAAQAAGLAQAFGASGWVISTATAPAINASLGQIESSIIKQSGENVTSSTPVTLSFEGDTRLDFTYDFVRREKPTGLVQIQLVRRPSLFVADTLPNRIPDYATSGRTDLAITDWFLGHQLTPNKTIREYLAEKSAGQLATFQQISVSPGVFQSACNSVRSALQSSDSGLNPHDSMAIFWAAWVGGNNWKQANLRSQPCLAGQLPAFPIYQLKVP